MLRRGVKYFRRFRLIRTVFTVFSVVFTLLGTGLAVLVLTVISLVVLPVAVLCGFAVVFASAVLRRRAIRGIEGELRGKRVSVFFPEREGKGLDSTFLDGVCRRLADEGETVLVVTPYFISPSGLGGRGGFLAYRKESESVYLVRRYLFFALRKKLLETETERTVCYY